MVDIMSFPIASYRHNCISIRNIDFNYPISIKERLTVAFHLPDTIGRVTGLGQVAWRQFHGDSPGHEKTIFTAGIKFMGLSKPSRKAVRDCVSLLASPPIE